MHTAQSGKELREGRAIQGHPWGEPLAPNKQTTNKMWCSRKLEEVDYFHEQMCDCLQDGDVETATYYVSAFLSSLKSISDYALEDMNRMLKLNISSNADIRRDFIRIEAKSIDVVLKKYFEEWTLLKNIYENDSLIRMRNISVHRRSPRISRGDLPPEFYPEKSGMFDEDEKEDLPPPPDEYFVHDDFGRIYCLEGRADPLEWECEVVMRKAGALVDFTEKFGEFLANNRTREAIELEPIFSHHDDDLFYRMLKKRKNDGIPG